MAPLFTGIGIGIIIGAPIFLAACLIRFLIASRYFVGGFVEAARDDLAHAHPIEGLSDAWEQGKVRAKGTLWRSLARNERQREWLVKHHVPPRIARALTRSIAG